MFVRIFKLAYRRCVTLCGYLRILLHVYMYAAIEESLVNSFNIKIEKSSQKAIAIAGRSLKPAKARYK